MSQIGMKVPRAKWHPHFPNRHALQNPLGMLLALFFLLSSLRPTVGATVV